PPPPPDALSGASMTFTCSSAAPTTAASYSVVPSPKLSPSTASNATGTLTINKAPATLTLSNLTQTYNGSPRPATATTSPAGLSGVSITYDGSATVPTKVAIYALVPSLTNANYTAHNSTGTL